MANNYNEALQLNNADLQAILTVINELPEANDIPTVAQAIPSIAINDSGLITATATQTAGYVESGTKSSTHQLAFQAAKTITPTTTSQTAVSSGYYTGGAVMVKGDANLVAGNIKSGVSIFGVTGNYEGSGGGSGTSMEDSLIARTLTSYTNDRVTSIGDGAFKGCTSLSTASFSAVTSIGSDAFRGCIRLESLYLTGSSQMVLSHSYAFSSTPIGGYTTAIGASGSIFIRKSMLSKYQYATNWTYFYKRMVGIEVEE